MIWSGVIICFWEVGGDVIFIVDKLSEFLVKDVECLFVKLILRRDR